MPIRSARKGLRKLNREAQPVKRSSRNRPGEPLGGANRGSCPRSPHMYMLSPPADPPLDRHSGSREAIIRLHASKSPPPHPKTLVAAIAYSNNPCARVRRPPGNAPRPFPNHWLSSSGPQAEHLHTATVCWAYLADPDESPAPTTLPPRPSGTHHPHVRLCQQPLRVKSQTSTSPGSYPHSRESPGPFKSCPSSDAPLRRWS